MSEPRTTCRECGEELWGAEELDGVCVGCKQEIDDEMLRDGEPDDDEDDSDLSEETCP